jgi:hypothetical protein
MTVMILAHLPDIVFYRSTYRDCRVLVATCGSVGSPTYGGVIVPPGNSRIAIVQNADSLSLFDDLDSALQSGSSERRIAMLRQVTDLFLSEAGRLTEEQIGVFDDDLVQQIARIETKTLAEISQRIAPVANAPIDLTLNLARHRGKCKERLNTLFN